jgi:Fe-S-cluster-containing hydrogenase component 2
LSTPVSARAPEDALSQVTAPRAQSRIVFEPQECRTCRACELACAIIHEGQASPTLARINVFFDEFREQNPISGRVCFQCEDAPCLDACPVEALYRDEATQAVVVDGEVCIGCMQCQDACPWGIPKLHPRRGIAIKCDLCYDRKDGPACVAICPLQGKALRYVRYDLDAGGRA